MLYIYKMNNNDKIETVNIGGEQVRVLYLTKKSSYTDAQKRAIYKYMEKNRSTINEQTRTREKRYYRSRMQKLIDEKGAVKAWYEMCNIDMN